MPSYETAISIAASQEVVWCVLSNVTARPEWLPTVSSVEPLNGQEFQVGSRFLVQQPKLRPATWVVKELEPPRRFAWLARSPGLRMFADHIIEEESPAASRVVLRFSFSGLVGALLGRLFRSVTMSYIRQEAAALGSKAEALAEDSRQPGHG